MINSKVDELNSAATDAPLEDLKNQVGLGFFMEKIYMAAKSCHQLDGI